MRPNTVEHIIKDRLGQRGLELFGRLATQIPESAEAIVLLQGDQFDRATKVLELFRANYAPLIVITGNNAMMERRRINHENDLYLSELVKYCRTAGIPESAIITDDKAMNTKDQAVNVIRLARERGWTRLLIVTSPYHLLRSFLTLIKQVEEQKWAGSIVMQAPKLEWTSRPSGRNKTVLEMLDEELIKMERYHQDLADLETGMQYENSFSRR
ncbi:MAG: YdcF family protein [Patescibacteria group bacterium]|mgnify:CR=1 FL=1